MKNIGTKWYGRIYTLFFINLLWVPFRADSLSVALKYIAGMFGIGSVSGLESRAMAFIPYLLMAVLLCFPLEKLFVGYEKNRSFSIFKGVFTVLLAVLAVSAVISSSFTTYIYGTF